MSLPEIVSRGEWRAARAELLLKEKAATRARDALSAERRGLPMVEVAEEYVFEGGTARSPCSTCSRTGASSSSTTSCSRPSGTRAAAAAPHSWIK